MKKFLTLAMALPLLFACSNDLDVIEEVKVSNDSFAGIEKVDATFTIADNQPVTRMATNWNIEVNDRFGFAWLTDKYGSGAPIIAINGNAYQNHPLNVVSNGSNRIFKPETSIYVGQYFLYYPYDEETVSVDAIKFNSLKEQTLADGKGKYNDLAETGIIIGDKWTVVSPDGWDDVNDNNWDKAGINNPFKLYSARFSNQSALDLTYANNNPKFAVAKDIEGASDIEFTIPQEETVGAAKIYEATVNLNGAAQYFTYAPSALNKEPMQVGGNTEHKGAFWADKKNIASDYGFTFTPGAIKLKAEDETNGVSTGNDGSTGWFWFNSLPVTAGTADYSTKVQTVLTTSYGVVTVNSIVGDCAWVNEKYDASATSYDWYKLDKTTDADNNTATLKTWKLSTGGHNTFVNQYGNHVGKYALEVDFSTGDMDGMEIKSDDQLQSVLKYYIAAGKTESPVKLNLDADEDGEFKLSKISIALLQTINDATHDIKLQKCATHGATLNIVITQDGQTTENGLANKNEVPTLNNVFAYNNYDIYLSKDYTWTLSKDYSTEKLKTAVNSITNLGILNVTSPVVNTTGNCDFVNANVMNVNAKVDFAQNLVNTGTINIASGAWLRAAADGKTITNQAGTAHGVDWGKIDNKGELSVKAGTTGAINNYGYIKNYSGALTLVTKNQITNTKFYNAFNATTNAYGEIEMEVATDYVSVSNGDAEGFITYVWTEPSYKTPDASYKFNYLKIASDIEFGFTLGDTKIKFLEFNGNSLQTVKADAANSLKSLKGIYVPENSSFVLDVKNRLRALEGVYVAGEIKLGGTLNTNGKKNSLYFGTTSDLGNISVWGSGTLQ